MTDPDVVNGDLTLVGLIQDAADRQKAEDAAKDFCERYMAKLLALVERNLARRFSSRLDAEDLVQSIFGLWFSDIRAGKIAISTEDEIWKLLSVIALNKVRNKVKFHDAQRRSTARTVSDDAMLTTVPEPSSEDAVAFMDMIQAASAQLEENARRTLELILDGKSVEDIARLLGRSTKSVSRYKKQIGKVLQDFVDEDLRSLCESSSYMEAQMLLLLADQNSPDSAGPGN